MLALGLVLKTLFLHLALADNLLKVRFLRNFLDSLDKPTSLIVWRNCFEEYERIEFIRNSFIPTHFNDQDSLNASDYKENPQHVLFTLDLTCFDDPESVIEKVNL